MPITQPHLFFAGFGYTAQYTSELCLQNGIAVSGTTRSDEKSQKMIAAGITPHLWQSPSALPVKVFNDVSHVVISTSPATRQGDGTCPALALKGSFADAAHLKRIIYLSTTGVYGDWGGDWVDETSPLNSTQKRSLNRMVAETAWAGFASSQNIPLTILRLAGIYGPQRNAITSLQDSARKNSNTVSGQRVVKEGHVFNRIHVRDIAAVIHHLIDKPASKNDGIFNLADDCPAPPQDVVTYAATLLGVAPPPLISFAEANLSEMGRSFYAENKRVRNDKIKNDLGIKLQYPDYKEGLKALI